MKHLAKYKNDVFYTPLLMTEDFLQNSLPKAVEQIKAGRDIPDPEEAPFLVRVISDVVGTVAIIKVGGVICHRGSFWSVFFGHSSVELIKEAIDFYLGRDDIKSIVLDVDSPGGTVDGVEELSNHIFESRGIKKIIGVANSMAASAGYWIISSCDEVIVSSKTSTVGSIGVLVVHADFSEMLKDEGVNLTQITSNKRKALTPSHKPLSDEGRKELERQVNTIFDVFVGNVARNRDLDEETIKEDLEGILLFGEESVSQGLADKVETLDSVINNLNSQLEDIIVGANNATGLNLAANVEPINMGLIETKHPEVFKAIKDQGYDQGFEKGKAEGKTEQADNETVKKESFESGLQTGLQRGAEQERKRIVGIQKATQEGYEKVARKAVNDGTTTAEQFSLVQAKDIGDKGGLTMNKIKNDNDAVPHAGGSESEEEQNAIVAGIVRGAENHREALAIGK